MRNMRCTWDAGRNYWMLDVPHALPQMALEKAREHVLRVQKDRFRGLPPGFKRDELRDAIVRLEQPDGLRQRVVGERGDSKGELVAFAAGRN